MSIALTVCIALVLIVLSVLGYVSDVRRALLALLGTLIGAALAQFWAARWGSWLTESVGGPSARNVFIASSVLFLWGALVVGYGGGLLLGRPAARPAVQQRLIGALLGLMNAILIVGFLLRYAAAQQKNFAAIVDATLAAQVIHDWLPMLFLVVAAAVTLLMLVRAIMSLAVRRAAHAPKPAAGPAPAAKPAPAADHGTLGNANDGSRQS